MVCVAAAISNIVIDPQQSIHAQARESTIPLSIKPVSRMEAGREWSGWGRRGIDEAR